MKDISLSVILIIFMANLASAQDFGNALARTVSQIPDGADVASMGNANTSLTSDYSTRNPGAVDASDFPRSKGAFSLAYGNINFKKGPDINLYILAGNVRLPVGTIQLSWANGGSSIGNIGAFGDKLEFDDFPQVELQYGLKISKNLLFDYDELYMGVGYGHSEANLSGRQMFEDSAIEWASKSWSNTFETGMLYRLAKKMNVGVMWLHSWEKERFSAGGFAETLYSDSDQIRVGVSAKVTSLTMVSADYRRMLLSGSENDNQFFSGIEQFFVKDFLAVYGGYANGGWTTGLGIYLPFGGINFAYMQNPFESTNDFLGRAKVSMIQAYGTF